MVVAKLIINAGKGMVLDKLVGKLFDSYGRFSSEPSKHEEAVSGYKLPDNNYFQGGNLREIAERYGIEGLLSDYNHSLFEKIKGYLAQLGKLVEYLRDVAQQKIPAQPLEIYTQIASAYGIMSGLLGYKAPSETKRYGYISDLVNDYMNQIGDLNSRLDKFLSIAEGFSTSSGVIGTAAKRTARFIAKEVLESKGIPVSSIEKVVSSTTKPFADLRRNARPLFVEYEDIVKNWQTAYAADVNAYLSSAYARAA